MQIFMYPNPEKSRDPGIIDSLIPNPGIENFVPKLYTLIKTYAQQYK